MNSPLKQVIHVENDEKSLNWRWYPQVKQDMEGITVCSMEYEVPQLIHDKVLPSNVQVGEILVKSPYDEKYIRIEDYEMTVMQDKIYCVEAVARLLGASKVESSIKITDIKKRNWDAEIGAMKVDLGEIDAKMRKEDESRLSQELIITSNYSKAKVPTIDDYKKAESYALAHNLLYDSGVKNLLDARNPSENNLLSDRTIHLNLSSELESNLDIAFKLNVLQGVFNLNTNFNMKERYSKTVVIDLKYLFAMP